MDISFDQKPECKSPSYQWFMQCKPMFFFFTTVNFSHYELNGRLKLTFVDKLQQKIYLCYFTPKRKRMRSLELREETSICTKWKSLTHKIPGFLNMSCFLLNTISKLLFLSCWRTSKWCGTETFTFLKNVPLPPPSNIFLSSKWYLFLTIHYNIHLLETKIIP